MSVDLDQVLQIDKRPSDYLFPNLPRAVALISHRLEQYSENNLAVDHQPTPLNYYHGGVSGKFTRGVRRKLADTFEVIIPIDTEQAEALAVPQRAIE